MAGPRPQALNPSFAAHDDLRFGAVPLPAASAGYDPEGDACALLPPGFHSPAAEPVPGLEVRGSFGAPHRYVLRIPGNWNGRLVSLGTPATRSEHACDAILGDYLLAGGYAFVAGNKGVPYNAVIEPLEATPDPALAYRIPFAAPRIAPGSVLRSGALWPARAEVGAWHDDLGALVRAARAHLRERTGREPVRTYGIGLSLGGAQVRALIEREPELLDGGVEWAAVLWDAEHHLLAHLPAFLRAMPAYLASDFCDRDAHDALVAAGFPPDRLGADPAHRSLWNEHYANVPFYADLTLFLFARLLDPEAGPLESLAERAAYRPSAAVRATIAAFAHRGHLERPLLGIAGEADPFVAPQHHFAPYLALVRAAGCAQNYRQFLIEGGTHLDSYVAYGYRLQAQLPFAWAAFERLVALVEGERPLARPGSCTLVRSPAEIARDA
ncbi:MAG: hypothetical protein ACREM2_02610 [Vulcanimicrobiaceae bacterium]